MAKQKNGKKLDTRPARKRHNNVTRPKVQARKKAHDRANRPVTCYAENGCGDAIMYDSKRARRRAMKNNKNLRSCVNHGENQ